MNLENPKRRHSSRRGSNNWFEYYAGYSPRFTKSLIETLSPPRGSVILDPWNGSGTTTEISSVMGYKTYGYDLNPAMVFVAKARMLDRRLKINLLPLSAQIVGEAERNKLLNAALDGDPLGKWFRPRTISHFRALEASIQSHLVEAPGYRSAYEIDGNEITPLTAFYYTALFRTVRAFLTPFLGSNPTWIRRARMEKERVAVDARDIFRVFRKEVESMVAALDDDLFCALQTDDYSLEVGSSESLLLPENSVTTVISSPPYCTRIDYAVATMSELAVLGMNDKDFRKLREGLIGTSTVPKSVGTVNAKFGSECKRFLEQVKNHSSKASSGYYFKNHLRYFESMRRSLLEISRVLVSGGRCVLVVQDSFYKDIHNNLPLIITQMADACSMKLEKRNDFIQKRTLAGINPAVRTYREDSKATESVLTFIRG